MDKRVLNRIRDDRVSFVVEVFLLEVIICLIVVFDGLDYKEVEEKYRKGLFVYFREKELFDKNFLKEMRKRLVRRSKV